MVRLRWPHWKLLQILSLSVALSATAAPAAAEEPLSVYSARSRALIQPLLDQYSSEHGVTIDVQYGKAPKILEQLRAEWDQTSADLLITPDAGNLWLAAEAGVLAEIDSELLSKNIPASLRDRYGRWFALSKRFRAIVYHRQRVAAEEIGGYQGLALPKWRDRLCLRTSNKIYNHSLVAWLIAQYGENRTEEIVRGWVDNLSLPPFAKDGQALQAVADGDCDLTIVNNYYYERFIREHPESDLALYRPDSGGEANHPNIAGAGVTRFSTNKRAAVKLLEWLSSRQSQQRFASENDEIPVHPEIAADGGTTVHSSAAQRHTLHISVLGEKQQEAIRLMARAGYR